MDKGEIVLRLGALRSLTGKDITVESLLRFGLVDVVFEDAEPGTCESCQARETLHRVHRVAAGPVEPDRQLCVACIAQAKAQGDLHPSARDLARLGLAPENDP